MTWLARSLQTRILAVVLLCVSIPGLLMGIYLLERNSEVLTAKTRESLANHLFRRANLVDDWMSQRLHEVQRWSTSFVVIEGLEQALSGGDTSQAAHDLRDYLDAVLAHYESYESLFVIGPRGRVLASTRAESWEEHPWSPLGHRSAALTTSLISPIHVSEKLGRPTLLVMHRARCVAPWPCSSTGYGWSCSGSPRMLSILFRNLRIGRLHAASPSRAG